MMSGLKLSYEEGSDTNSFQGYSLSIFTANETADNS